MRVFDEQMFDSESPRVRYQDQQAATTAPATFTSVLSDAPKPGPAAAPEPAQDQGPPPQAQAPAPPPQAAPPAIVSAVGGIQGSQETGGVKGTFEQAGTRRLTERLGGDAPAVWFRNMMAAGKPTGLAGTPGASRAATTAGGGYAAGAAIPSASALPTGPSAGGVGGGAQDEEWQRFIQQVLAQRFGRG